MRPPHEVDFPEVPVMPDPKRTKSAFPPFARPLLAGALAATALSAVDAQAAIFLKITGPDIKGESTNDKHKDEIGVNSFTAGFAAAGAAIGIGAGAGRPSCGPVEISKMLDVSSGPLVAALMKGTVLQKAVFSFTNTNTDKQQDYYVVTLSNVTLSSFAQSSGGDKPSESLEFLPRQVEFKYSQQQADGSVKLVNTTVVDCTTFKF
jgi:type VI secretion system secreted protein Hcp